jgi:hypothetical protein
MALNPLEIDTVEERRQFVVAHDAVVEVGDHAVDPVSATEPVVQRQFWLAHSGEV